MLPSARRSCAIRGVANNSRLAVGELIGSGQPLDKPGDRAGERGRILAMQTVATGQDQALRRPAAVTFDALELVERPVGILASLDQERWGAEQVELRLEAPRAGLRVGPGGAPG